MLTATNIHRTWKTADGHVVMMIVEDAQFHAICRAIDREDFERDPRFDGLLSRLGNGVALYALLEVELAKWSTAELVERARRFGAPLAPVNGVREFMADPQARSNHTVFEVEDPRAGTLRQVSHPARYAETPATLRRLPPQRGEHTDEVLAEVGYSDAEIRALRERGAVA
jgi:formyl-CoA transferase/CoA:oxalate CoA-transferase